jgi:5'-nucleotidase (lipoprotein e(P4) family)
MVECRAGKEPVSRENDMRTKLSLALLMALLLAGCATVQSPATVPTAAAVPSPTPAAVAVPADDALNATLWTQRAVEHDLIYQEVYHVAEQKLVAALADPTWDALPHEERVGSPANLPPAVIADVDETLLNTSAYETELIRTGQEYNDFTWGKWCHQETARALPGAVEFARFAVAHGVTVFYITNRTVDLTGTTIANLRKVGFPVPDDKFVLGLGTVVPGCEMFGSEKGCRRRLVGRDYRVLMQFGDQIGDFVDVIANTPTDRANSIAPYSHWFGERWFMLPNTIYGSWEPACFNNDWRLPREERRADKIKCLRTE